jgi:hypothetical protein
MWKSLASCADNARLISRQLDEPLPLRSRLLLLIHLAGCQSCRRYSGQVRFLRGVFAGYERRSEGLEAESLPAERRSQIKALLRSASSAPDGSTGAS